MEDQNVLKKTFKYLHSLLDSMEAELGLKSQRFSFSFIIFTGMARGAITGRYCYYITEVRPPIVLSRLLFSLRATFERRTDLVID